MEGIPFLNIEDLVPMKLQAVSNRNAKKDYWDITILMQTYSVEKMLNTSRSGFPNIDPGFIIHSLAGF